MILYWIGYLIGNLTGRLVFGMKVIGKENVPKEGGFMLAGNHISNYDPLMYGSFLPRAIHYMGKKELFDNKLLGAIIKRTNAHPINRRGFDRNAMKTAYKLFDSGEGMLIFPEGTRSKTDEFLRPKPGVGLMARKAKVPIVPAYLHGTNKLKDCLFRKDRLGLIYGPPITKDEIEKFDDSREGYQALSDEIMNRVSQLRDKFKKAISVKE